MPERDPADAAPWVVTSATRVWVAGQARRPRPLVERLLLGGVRSAEGDVDLAVILPASADELDYFCRKISRRLHAEGQVWVVCREHGDGADDAVSLDAVSGSGRAMTARVALDDTWVAVRIASHTSG